MKNEDLRPLIINLTCVLILVLSLFNILTPLMLYSMSVIVLFLAVLNTYMSIKQDN